MYPSPYCMYPSPYWMYPAHLYLYLRPYCMYPSPYCMYSENKANSASSWAWAWAEHGKRKRKKCPSLINQCICVSTLNLVNKYFLTNNDICVFWSTWEWMWEIPPQKWRQRYDVSDRTSEKWNQRYDVRKMFSNIFQAEIYSYQR